MKELFSWKSLTTVVTALCFTLSVPAQAVADEAYAGGPDGCCEPVCAPVCGDGWFTKIAAIALGGAAGAVVGASYHKRGHRGDDGDKGCDGPEGSRGRTGPQGPNGTVEGPTGPTGPTGISPTGPQGPQGATGSLPFNAFGSLSFTFSNISTPTTPVVGGEIDVFVVDPEQNVYVDSVPLPGGGVNITINPPNTFIGAYKWGFYIRDIDPNHSAAYNFNGPITVDIQLDGGDIVTYFSPSNQYTKGDQYVQEIGYDPLNPNSAIPIP